MDLTVEALLQAQKTDAELKKHLRLVGWLAASQELPKLEEVTPLSGGMRTHLQH